MNAHDILVQLIGVGGLLCFLLSYQVKSNRSLFLAQSAGIVLFVIQFVFLGAYSGCLNLMLGVVRNLTVLKYNEWAWVRKKIVPIIFIVGFAAVTVYTWNGWTSLFPFAGMASCTIAFWTNNALNIRKANLFIASPAWIVYDVIFHSWAGVMNELVTIFSILLSIWRFGWKNLGDPNSGFGD
ncbi:MAG: YgjV family protein [Eubacterium sp.]|nr:YgjV family protein [Eubacterium sp.]